MDNKEISDSDEIRRRIADAKEKLDRIKYLSEKTEELVALSEASTKLLPEIKRERELANTEFLEFKNEINTFVNDQKANADREFLEFNQNEHQELKEYFLHPYN